MKLRRFLDCLCMGLLLFGLRVSAQSTPTYSLVVPNSAIRGSNLQALLYTYRQVPHVAISVSDGNLKKLQSFTLNPSSSGVSSINIVVDLAWLEGSYTLTAEASDGSFNATASFEVIQKSHSVFVLTDKAIYKPSQTVNFRVLVTTAELKPFSTNISVTVEDAEGHKINQWANQPLTLGVASFSLPLSSGPTLGVWTIKVVAGDELATKTFEVREYVLPRFSVSITLPTYITASQSHVYGSISALYTYGEGVQGVATIKFQLGSKSLIRVLSVNGNRTFDLGPEDLAILGLVNSSYYSFEAAANFTETLTGTVQTASASLDVSPYDAEITFLPATSEYFKKGINFTAYIKVAHPDGSLLSEPGLQLLIVASYSTWIAVPAKRGQEIETSSETVHVIYQSSVSVPQYGIVAVTIPAPDNGTDSFNIHATMVYKGQTIESDKYVSSFTVRGKNNIGVQILGSTDSLKSGDTVRLSVRIVQRTRKYYYLAVARGRIVSQGVQSATEFDVVLTAKHAPQTTFLVHVLGSDGEIVADAVTVNVAGALENKVELSFQDNQGNNLVQATPGGNVTLQVSSDPDSLVGLLSVDQSVLLLSEGNDLSQKQLLEELLSYNSNGDLAGPAFFDFFFPRWGGASSRQLFVDAGLTISTDAVIEGFRFIFFEKFQVAGALGPAQAVAAVTDNSAANNGAVRTRKLFPETWIWSLLQLNSRGKGSLPITVPDTITSWVTTAFSMNANSGLTVTPSANKFKVFQNFFVSAILPYSIVRGEEALLKVVVFNYMEREQLVTITLKGSPSFSARLDGTRINSIRLDLSTTVTVAAGSGSTVQFWIVPQRLGVITIVIAAISPEGGDRVENTLLVKPEGIPQGYCLADVAILRTPGNYNNTFSIQYPPVVVSESAKVEIRVSGDLMGPSIQGLENLVQVPYGCGEQNMITFTPNIFVREYLEAVGLLDPVIQARTQTNMLLGYQRQLTYLRKDGFFSAFGDSDTAGSTWLTAFTLKSFRQAQRYLASSIDENVLRNTKDRLLNDRYLSNGSFVEYGRVIHVDMQGGSGAGLPLTAYLVIALIEDNLQDNATLLALSASISLLENSLGTISNDAYALAIVTYALHLARSANAYEALILLESLSVSADGAVHWTKNSSGPSPVTCHYCPPPSGASAVEMTSYALLTYVKRGDLIKAAQVAKWLAGQRNSLGGYTSTQDTVLALQALASYSRLVRPSNFSLRIRFSSSSSSEVFPDIFVDAANSLLLQVNEVQHPEALSTLTFSAVGQGSAIISVCVSYNVFAAASQPVVDTQVSVARSSASSPIVQLQACGKSSAPGGSAAGMGIIEVDLPSGYIVDNGAVRSNNVRRVDYGDSKVALYFDEFNSSWICATIPMQQSLTVSPVKDAYVKVYNYYNPGQYKIIAYNPVDGGTTNAPATTARVTASPARTSTTVSTTKKPTTTTKKPTTTTKKPTTTTKKPTTTTKKPTTTTKKPTTTTKKPTTNTKKPTTTTKKPTTTPKKVVNAWKPA